MTLPNPSNPYVHPAVSVEYGKDGRYGLSYKERDIIRHNWNKLGYTYWFSEFGVERWMHPETEHVVTFPN